MEDDKLEQENIKTEKLNTNEESIASTTIPEDSSSSSIEKNKTNNENTEQIEKDSTAIGSDVKANIEDKKQNQESVETIEKKDIAEDFQNKDLKKDIPKQESKKYYFEDEILSDLIVRPPLETENTNLKDEVKFDKDSQTIESKTNSKTDENSEEKIKQDYPEKKSSEDPKENNSEKKENKESTNEASSKNTKEETEDLTYIEKLTLERKEKAVAEEEKSCKKTDIDFWKFFVSDAVFLLICLFLTIVLIQKLLTSGEVAIVGTNQVHSSLESGEKTTIGNINILVMGIDSVEGTHRSDTIFILGIMPSKNKITMLSIPRDTRVIIENRARKINEILPRYGDKVLMKILEDLFKIKISRKVEIGFESFISVIDSIGGVDINVEKAMHYDDNWGNLHIHFNKGLQHLDGANALRYVRFRKDAMADLGRIKRQQDFVKSVVEKAFSPSCIIRLPSIIEKAFKFIKTDFTLQEILTLAKGFNSLKINFRTLSLAGEARYIDKISYFLPYSDEAVNIGNSYFSDLALFELETDCKTEIKLKNQNRKK